MQATDKQTAADRPYAKILKAKTPRCAALDFIILSLLQRAFVTRRSHRAWRAI
jgi:hypothetical protein